VGHYKSTWKWAYERYREIETSARAEDKIALLAVFYPKQAAELTKARGKSPRRDILSTIKKLQGLYAAARKVSGRYDDVYQAAFSMVGDTDVDERYPQLDQVTRLYRGQRINTDTWPVIPKLLRGSPSDDEKRNRIRRAHGFAMVLQKLIKMYYRQKKRRAPAGVMATSGSSGKAKRALRAGPL
jgi:hypothetical protein